MNNKLKSWVGWFVIVICVGLNLLGRTIASGYEIPFWFDSIGTILAAVVLGPIAGAVCGLLLNAIISFADPVSLPYMAVSIAIGVSVGVFYPRRKRNVFKAISTMVMTGILSAVISTPLNIIIYDGKTGNAWGDSFMDMLARDIQVKAINSFLGEAFVDIPDKVLSFIIAFVLMKLMGLVSKGHRSAARAVGLLLVLSIIIPVMFYPVESRAADFSSEYAGTLYDTESGLESVEINAIAQTKDGYMWVGSYSGLYRYDGYRFRSFAIDERIKNVMVLFVDSKGRLWIGTNDSGVGCYDVDTGEIEFFDTGRGLASDAIRAICEDSEGNIYVATIKQLCKIDQKGEIEVFMAKSFYGVSKLSSSGDTVAGVRSDGSLMIFRDKKIIYVLAGNYTDITKEDEGNYIIGNSSNMTGRLFIKDGMTDIMSKHLAGKLTYFNDILYSKTFKGYFIACENGLGFISDTGVVTDLSTSDFNTSIVDIYVDYQDNVWFASSKQGIKKFSWNPFEDIYAKAHLENEVVNSVLVKGGVLYAGTGSGLKTIDLKTFYSVPIPHPEVLRDVRIRCVMSDSDDNIWFSTYGPGGLVVMHPDKTINTYTRKYDGTEGEKFRSTFELSDGTIVAVSSTCLNFIKNERVFKKLGEDDGITTQVLCMVEDADGTIYAGSDGGGIFVIKNFRVVDTIGAEDGLKSQVVMKITPCRGGYLYVTSNAIYYNNGAEIKPLNSFPYSNNYDVFIDENKKAWVLSSAGIFVLDERDLLSDKASKYMLLNRTRGLSTSVTANGFYSLNGDNLYLPCTDGVRKVSTTDYDSFNNKYEIRVSEIFAGDDVIEPENGVYRIPAISGRIVFDVAVMNYALSNPLLHIFLEGTEDEGVTCYQKDMQSLTYTNLPYGNYRLHVQVLDTAGKHVIREEIFPVLKESQLYERRYFRIYLFVVSFLLVAYIGWAIASLVQEMNSIQRLEQEASKDPLTGLLNKRGSTEALRDVLGKRNGILAILDLDSFKPVNDIYGHDMGDRMLIDLAEILRRSADSKDVLCRIGGDEFLAFYADTTPEQMEIKTGFLNEAIMEAAKKHMGDDMSIPLGVSVGGVSVPVGSQTEYDELFRRADRALYSVKNAGKHGCRLYEEIVAIVGDESNISGISELKAILGERGKSDKPYRVERERMQDIYRLLVRYGDNEILNSALVHFTILGPEGAQVTPEIMELFLDTLMENLRNVDVYGNDSGNRVIVLLSDVSREIAGKIADRMINKWNENPKNEGFKVTYEKEML